MIVHIVVYNGLFFFVFYMSNKVFFYIMIIIIIIIIIIIARGDSSAGKLLCVFLFERFAVRISPLAFFVDAPYMCGSQKNALARLYWVFLYLPDRCVCGGI